MHKFNNSLLYQIKPRWVLHGLEWDPAQDSSGGIPPKTIRALFPTLTALRVMAVQYQGNLEFISCEGYRDRFQSVLQIGVLPNVAAEDALSAIVVADAMSLGYSPVDSQTKTSAGVIATTGIIPTESVEPFTAVRLSQFYVPHKNDTYVIRFAGYIPTPNDDCSYDDEIFFGCPSKIGFPLFLTMEMYFL